MTPLSKWLRGLTRAGKVQRRSVDKLVKQLLRAPPALSKPRVKAPAMPSVARFSALKRR